MYIETVEAFPDTTIQLTNGRRYVVKESVDEVTGKSLSFFREVNLLDPAFKGGGKE
jgi:flagellar protein FlbD